MNENEKQKLVQWVTNYQAIRYGKYACDFARVTENVSYYKMVGRKIDGPYDGHKWWLESDSMEKILNYLKKGPPFCGFARESFGEDERARVSSAGGRLFKCEKMSQWLVAADNVRDLYSLLCLNDPSQLKPDGIWCWIPILESVNGLYTDTYLGFVTMMRSMLNEYYRAEKSRLLRPLPRPSNKTKDQQAIKIIGSSSNSKMRRDKVNSTQLKKLQNEAVLFFKKC
jgi:hypothetical protein